MKTAEEIERSLEGLAPAALSEEARDSIESMIDSLASENPGRNDVREEPRNGWGRPAAWMSLAAAVAFGAFGVLTLTQPGAEVPGGQADTGESGDGGLEWVGRSDRVEEPEDGGLLADEDGGMHRLLRYRVIEEELIRDGRNGMVMRVTGPRDEMMLVPVSTF